MYLIKNGLIYTMADEIIEDGCILVKDGKIVEIGKNIGETKDMEVIDAKGQIVTPGLVEAHSHIGLSEDGIGFEGNDHNERVDPITPHLRVIDGLNPMDNTLKEAREAGITTAVPSPGSANVIGGQCAAIKLYGNRIDDMIIKEPVAMKIAFGENPKRVYSGQKKSPATRMGTAALLRETLFKTREYLNKKENGDNPAFDMKLEALIPVIKGDIPVKVHAHRADDIFTAVRIIDEFGLKATIDHCTEGELIADELKKINKPLIVGPSFGRRSKFELKNKSFKAPAALSNQGLKISITTDSPVVPLEYLPLCAGLAIKSGLDEMEAFKAITIYPAEMIGIEDRVGSLEVGKDADIVIFQGHPLLDVDHEVMMTMIDGNIVYSRD